MAACRERGVRERLGRMGSVVVMAVVSIVGGTAPDAVGEVLLLLLREEGRA